MRPEFLPIRTRILFSTGMLQLLVLPARLFSQQTAASQDTMPHYVMESVVITADRFQNKVAHTTSSVSVLESDEVRRLPAGTLSDALQYVPGFFVVPQDGLGRDPIICTRGFYGGGEAEYVQVLVDGKQVNDLETGLVDWNLVPLSSIGTVEVSRGASSPLYGDAALGGVINVSTRMNDATHSQAVLEGGSYGLLNGVLSTQGFFGNNPYQLSASDERSGGFRSHSNWQGSTIHGGIAFPLGESSKLQLSSLNQWTKADDAGPLTQEEFTIDRTGSSPYYKADGKDEKRYQVQAEFSHSFSQGAELSSLLFYNRKDGDRIRTFVTPAEEVKFFPAFAVIGVYDTTLYGDTQERELHNNEGGVSVKFDLSSQLASMKNRVVMGFDGTYGHLQSTSFRQFAGFEADYAGMDFSRGQMLVDGTGAREKYGIYVSDEVHIGESVTATVGARFDGISDRYDGTKPDTSLTADHSAFSPKVGLNVRLADDQDVAGSLYVSVNRSFKAPTLDQFSDQRPINAALFMNTGSGSFQFIPGMFPPFSNVLLRPQKGTTYEIGTYERIRLLNNLFGEAVISLYQMDMTDEIDFDFATFKYQNIQESRHRGAEIGLRLYSTPGVTAFVNYTWSNVKFTSGPNSGNFLKAIPRNVVTLGTTYEHSSGIEASLVWNFTNGMFLDDVNSSMLSDYDFGNAKISYLVSPITFSIQMDNVLNEQFNSTGYSDYGKTFLFPAAGRSVRAGVRVDF